MAPRLNHYDPGSKTFENIVDKAESFQVRAWGTYRLDDPTHRKVPHAGSVEDLGAGRKVEDKGRGIVGCDWGASGWGCDCGVWGGGIWQLTSTGMMRTVLDQISLFVKSSIRYVDNDFVSKTAIATRE